MAGARPRPLEVAGLGPSLRVAFWNIERGLKIDDILLFVRDKDAFMAKLKEERDKAKANGESVRDGYAGRVMVAGSHLEIFYTKKSVDGETRSALIE